MDIVKQLSSGMLATLAIFFLTLIFSMPLGLLVCEIRKSRIGIVRWIARIYISIMRGTPLMLQLLVVFFGPYYLFGMKVTATYRFYAVIIGFALNYAAYFAEIYRGGIESIPKGQYEAAEVLGYSKVQTFNIDGCKVRVHFPDLPEEERAKRKNALMKAAERFLKHAERVKKEKAEQENMPEAKEG